MSRRYGERNPPPANSDSKKSSWMIFVVVVVIILIVFILALLAGISRKKGHKDGGHGPHKLESFLGKQQIGGSRDGDGIDEDPRTGQIFRGSVDGRFLAKSENKVENERPFVSHQKPCGCTQPCICEKKKKEKPGFCPPCPSCPTCPICPPICPEDCPECPLCPGGLGSNCTMNNQCAAGFQCRDGICICPKPPPPVNLTATPIFDQTGPGFKLTITWSAVMNANFYDIIVSGPSPQNYLNFVGTSVTTPILLPGIYTVTVYAGSNQCGTDSTGVTVGQIVISPVPGGPCNVNSQCPPNQLCFQGTCIDPVV